MTKEEIMKGLECCQTKYDKRCKECPIKFLKLTTYLLSLVLLLGWKMYLS